MVWSYCTCCKHHVHCNSVVLLWQGDAGSIQLARALKEHTNEKLVEVDIGYNEIKDEGACALAQVRSFTCVGADAALFLCRILPMLHLLRQWC